MNSWVKLLGNYLRRVFSLIQLLSLVDIADTMAALSSKVIDFEDALVGVIAKRIKADYFVTRNTKDFTNSPVLAINPKRLMRRVLS